jgi:hypothetical protein
LVNGAGNFQAFLCHCTKIIFYRTLRRGFHKVDLDLLTSPSEMRLFTRSSIMTPFFRLLDACGSRDLGMLMRVKRTLRHAGLSNVVIF